MCGLDSTGSDYGLTVNFCEHGNESSDSIKGRKLLDQLSNYQLFVKYLELRSYYLGVNSAISTMQSHKTVHNIALSVYPSGAHSHPYHVTIPSGEEYDMPLSKMY
jgi:hypothetical protein